MLLVHVSRQSVEVAGVVGVVVSLTHCSAVVMSQVAGAGAALTQINKSWIPGDTSHQPRSSLASRVGEGCEPHVCAASIWVLFCSHICVLRQQQGFSLN